MKTLAGGAAMALAVLAVSPAWAQQVEIHAPAPAREAGRPEVIAPGLHDQVTRPSDSDYYPQGTRVQHDPAFIVPFTATWQTPTSSGRVGLSGWTAPNPPVGSPVSGHREVIGWFALGFSVTWDGPPDRRAVR
jgi:hypothetical protein